MTSHNYITQFVDTDRIADAHIAKALGATNGIAWDIYLFYDSDEQWENGAATPHDWVHQLRPCSWAPVERLRCGDDLKAALRQQAHRMIENQ
ncbi:hypothetical protein [Haladaptatus halobius]|uniref:hypothetical protein n=1 Tax=Haladaptatus halobius TaxID=2884875 RepID=UPI001D0A182E|nr:hypothetical protein [Haladaptatus halobius]